MFRVTGDGHRDIGISGFGFSAFCLRGFSRRLLMADYLLAERLAPDRLTFRWLSPVTVVPCISVQKLIWVTGDGQRGVSISGLGFSAFRLRGFCRRQNNVRMM